MKIEHKHVSSVHATHYECGIIVLVINTHERWIPYHMATPSSFFFGDPDQEHKPEDYLNIPGFEHPEMRLATQLQDKDQILVYFIPFALLRDGQAILG